MAYRLVEELALKRRLDTDSYRTLITASANNDAVFAHLRDKAAKTAITKFGYGIFIRGLIEISSYCSNDCLYCGLRRSNIEAERYRLSDEDIMECCATGYDIGFRTFVLQGGEDRALTDDRLIPIVSNIHGKWPEAAITLSLGERTDDSFRKLFHAGASRYLLRHEAADESLYNSLHPVQMSWSNRISCINRLIGIGYQTGMGMIVGLPGQSVDSLIKDLSLMERIQPHMIGIGPFIPHRRTPLCNNRPGDIRLTLIMIAISRLMFPDALIPATTALATVSSTGRKEGILSGANVVMPNLSPVSTRHKYAIYDNKVSSAAEAAENINLLEQELNRIGYRINYSRGDYNTDINHEQI